MNYLCKNCNHAFESPKPRKACPGCKKRKLEEVVARKSDYDFSHQFIAPGRENRDIYDDKGNKIGKKGKSSPVQAKIPDFVDLDEVETDPADQRVKKSLKKGKVARAARRDRQVTKVEKNCSGCSRPFLIYPWQAVGTVFRCDRCIRGLGE